MRTTPLCTSMRTCVFLVPIFLIVGCGSNSTNPRITDVESNFVHRKGFRTTNWNGTSTSSATPPVTSTAPVATPTQSGDTSTTSPTTPSGPVTTPTQSGDTSTTSPTTPVTSTAPVATPAPPANAPAATGNVIQVDPSMSQSQIQSKINESQAGDTVAFAAGTYNLASNGSNPNGAALNLGAGRIYTGPSSGSPAHLAGSGGYPLMYFAGKTVTIEYLMFDNGLLFLENGVTSAIVDNNTFENIDCGVNASQTSAIFVAGGLNDSDISYNTFKNIGQTCNSQYQNSAGAGGITLYAFHNLTINHNTFDTVYEGIDIPNSGGGGYDGAGSHINYNTFTGIHRMAIELLGTSTNPSGLEVAYNKYSNALNPWAYTFGLSLTDGQNMIVHDNVLTGNNNQPGYVPYAIEIAGHNSSAYNNIIEGYWGWGFSIGASAVNGISIQNNMICGPAMSAAPESGSNPVAGNANGFISWQSGNGTGTFASNTTSSALTCSR